MHTTNCRLCGGVDQHISTNRCYVHEDESRLHICRLFRISQMPHIFRPVFEHETPPFLGAVCRLFPRRTRK